VSAQRLAGGAVGLRSVGRLPRRAGLVARGGALLACERSADAPPTADGEGGRALKISAASHAPHATHCCLPGAPPRRYGLWVKPGTECPILISGKDLAASCSGVFEGDG
jgi:hypothetical protein